MIKVNKNVVLVTGSEGFIGLNLVAHLKLDERLEVLTICRKNSEKELASAVKKSDVIFHLAGENRPENPAQFDVVNHGMTEKICNLIKGKTARTTLIFASTSRIGDGSEYAKSKKKAEDVVVKLCSKEPHYGIIIRLTNVFGKWSKPFYNSVVATFCYQASRGIPLKIDDKNTTLNLAYIDDVVEDLIALSSKFGTGFKIIEYENTFKISLGDLASKLCSFAEERKISLPFFDSDHDKKLYSTFVSFLNKESFCYNLVQHKDMRGAFSEIWRTFNQGQFSVFTVSANSERGNHFHHSKVERFSVVSGAVEYFTKSFDGNDTFAIGLCESLPAVTESVPGWSHKFVNNNEKEAVVLVWANEPFDSQKPDTIFKRV